MWGSFFYITFVGNLKTNKMDRAKIYFKTAEKAERFAIAFSRHTSRGHVVTGCLVQVDVTEEDKEFIKNYK